MPRSGPPETGTLVIAALLLLALTFAGYWIMTYVQPGSHPWALLPWFGAAALIILAAGFFTFLLKGRGRQDE
jgi:hypothetical protein